MAGYDGEGPQGLVKILNYFDFDFDEKDIFQKRIHIKLDILKNNLCLREPFKHYHIPYYTYLDSPFIS